MMLCMQEVRVNGWFWCILSEVSPLADTRAEYSHVLSADYSQVSRAELLAYFRSTLIYNKFTF